MNFSGDENVFNENSKFLEHIKDDISKGDNFTTSFKKRTDRLYGFHFMPGVSLIMALPQLFTDEAKFLRLTLLVFNVSIIFFLSVIICKHFSPLRSVIFLLLMGVLPLNILGTMILWNDYMSGIILLFSYITLSNAFSHSAVPRAYYRKMLLVGITLGLSFLFRYNTIAVVFFLGVFLFFDLVVRQRRVRFFTMISMYLLLGFFLLYGPWMIASSIKHDRLVFVPKAKMDYEIRTWAISPQAEDLLGYRRTPRYYTKVYELQKLHGINGYAAKKLVLEEVQQTATIRSRIRAYRANLDNFFKNPNQFLSVMMYKAYGGTKSDWGVDVTAKPLIYLYTNGGQTFPKTRGYPNSPNHYMQPKGEFQRSYLLWNDCIYGLLIAFLLASFCVSITHRAFLTSVPYIWPFNLGICLVVLFHPAHGRYIFALIPILIYTASCFCESLVNLWRVGDKKAAQAVCILTSLFFIGVMM